MIIYARNRNGKSQPISCAAVKIVKPIRWNKEKQGDGKIKFINVKPLSHFIYDIHQTTICNQNGEKRKKMIVRKQTDKVKIVTYNENLASIAEIFNIDVELLAKNKTCN